MNDLTMSVAEYAMRGLALRADVRAHNLANANTPNFRAMSVEFESSLRAALERGAQGAAPAPVVSPAMNLPDADGSTVSVEGEMVGMLKDNLMRDAMVNAFNYKAGVIRTAISGQR